jgi:hypothetical protein
MSAPRLVHVHLSSERVRVFPDWQTHPAPATVKTWVCPAGDARRSSPYAARNVILPVQGGVPCVEVEIHNSVPPPLHCARGTDAGMDSMMSAPPPRPSSQTPEELGFRPQPMVRWLSPSEASQAAIRVLLSKIFGDYADKRELQAALEEAQPGVYTTESELWIDYVADLGEGFDSTYSIASLLAQPTLDIASPHNGEPVETHRGRILVMGGDEVYPTAHVQAYQDRLLGPYRAALPYTAAHHPHLYAIPGNHDWYDGLTAFLRTFCQQRWIGGWQTKQTRSYFALQLPHRWWLWSIDIQFDTSLLDEPQLRYFEHLAREHVRPGDSIILCSAKPSWTDTGLGKPEAYRSLDYVERRLINPTGARLRLALSGDKHHYAHYAEVGGDGHKITAGGGGAYLLATHQLPQELELPSPASTDPAKTKPATRWRLMTTFPSRRRSRALRASIWRLPFLNPGIWLVLAILLLCYSWTVFQGTPRALPFSTVAARMIDSPGDVVLNVGLLVGLMLFTKARSRVKAFALGLPHATAHFLLAVGVNTVTGSALATLPLGWTSPIALAAMVCGPGALLSCWLFALYLLVADTLGHNTNELFVAQRIEDYKNLLRLHLDRNGVLTVYPIGVPKVAHHWRLRHSESPEESWLESAGAPLAPSLIEDPIRLEPDRNHVKGRYHAEIIDP